MLAGISIFCFAASYSVALFLEITRLWFRSGVRGAFILLFAVAGLVAHTLFLGYLGYLSQQNSVAPLSSAAEYYLLGAWVLAAVYLYVTLALPKTPSGLFILPLVLLLIYAGHHASFVPFPTDRAAQVWGRTHGIFLLLGYVAVSFGFVVGAMYLLQANRLKQKLPGESRLKLPPLEWLERANHRATVWAPVLVGAGFVSGIILNVVRSGEIPWNDPVVWRSAAMVVWLSGAALFAGWYMPAAHGRKVAYLTVASFVFLIASVIVGFAFPTAHKVEDPKPTAYVLPRPTTAEVRPCN
ncbi:MAG: cytochrome c biogenesis protein CcsA [Pirellulales bacterium]